MSQPNTKSEMHEAVDFYCREYIGEPTEALYLHEEIDNPDARSERYELFREWLED